VRLNPLRLILKSTLSLRKEILDGLLFKMGPVPVLREKVIAAMTRVNIPPSHCMRSAAATQAAGLLPHGCKYDNLICGNTHS